MFRLAVACDWITVCIRHRGYDIGNQLSVEWQRPRFPGICHNIVCNAEGKKLSEFCERNILEILSGEYGADIKGESTFINHAEKSAIGYEIVSEGLISNSVVRLQIVICYC
jgi:hypothetical protein